MKNNNKGFSLVELLVVIAIMGIVAVVSSLSYSAVRRADVTKAARTIDSVMSEVRMNNMSKADPEYLYIYEDNGSYYYKVTGKKARNIFDITGRASEEAVELCSDSIEVGFESESVDANNMDNPGQFLAISFEKSTGAFKCFSATRTYVDDIGLEKIKFSRSGKESIITVATDTGKHVIS